MPEIGAKPPNGYLPTVDGTNSPRNSSFQRFERLKEARFKIITHQDIAQPLTSLEVIEILRSPFGSANGAAFEIVDLLP